MHPDTLNARGLPGYGAQPHGSEAIRREGYPSGPATSTESPDRPRTTWRFPVKGAPLRAGSQRATDAASRHEKPAVSAVPAAYPFLPSTEKSSIKSTH